MKKENHKNYTVNHNFFKIWSEESAWILGFWISDGCVHKASKNTYRIMFSQNNIQTLESVKNILQSDHYISKSKNTYNFSFCSNEMYSDILKIFNVDSLERKSLLIKWPKTLPEQYEKAFCRGLIDGDGSITKSRGKPVIHFCSGSEQFVISFIEIIDKHTGIKPKIKKGDGVWMATYNSISAKCIISFLYTDSKIHCETKKGLANKAIEWKPEYVISTRLSEKTKVLFRDIINDLCGSTKKITSSSGLRGVNLFCNGKWRATIRKTHLGYFKTPEEAAQVYDNAAREIYGKNARLNFPNKGELKA